MKEQHMKAQAMLGALAAIALFGSAAYAASNEDNLRDAQALSSAKVSIADAVRKAERDGNGRAISYELIASSQGPAAYEVKVLSNDDRRLIEYRIDADTGHIVSRGNEPVQKLLTRVKPEQINSAPMSLTHAIDSAEQQSGGKATSASIDARGDHVIYDVKLAKLDGSGSHIKVDSSTGHLASAN
jgi:uncharacterized membrane protein YkoI